MDIEALVKLLIEKGADAMPIISTVLLVIVSYFYRKDTLLWQQQSRADLQSVIQTMERNTAILNRVAEISQIRAEQGK